MITISLRGGDDNFFMYDVSKLFLSLLSMLFERLMNIKFRSLINILNLESSHLI